MTQRIVCLMLTSVTSDMALGCFILACGPQVWHLIYLALAVDVAWKCCAERMTLWMGGAKQAAVSFVGS
jgi:hypothetical protein